MFENWHCRRRRLFHLTCSAICRYTNMMHISQLICPKFFSHSLPNLQPLTQHIFTNTIMFVEHKGRRYPYNLYVWTALTAMILNLADDGAVCELDCPTACPFTLWLSARPFFGCFGAVYVRDVLPSCDDFPIPNNDASLELQHFDRNHNAANVCKFALQRMPVWKQASLTWSPVWNRHHHLLETCWDMFRLKK